MKVYEFGKKSAPALLLLPGTCCHWKGNFGRVIPLLEKDFRVLCVSYDGFDETESTEFPTMLEETEKIEAYIKKHCSGHIHGAYGCSLGGSFVGLLAARQNIHMDYGILGSSDLDRSPVAAAKLQTALLLPRLYPFIRDGKFKSRILQKRLQKRMGQTEAYVQAFMDMLGGGRPYVTMESCKNQFYSDLITPLPDQINVPGTEIHIFYALKMGKKYRLRYLRHFDHPAIHEQELRHEELLACYSEHFSGKLLEVPAGTGILTVPLYQTLPEADITCLDYSADMMGQAQEKAEHLRLNNVTFRQGDVGALSYEDNTFDIVLSLNGFHAFPDKEAAYREVFRVLRPGGTFCGCFYVKGAHKRTDWFVRHIYEKTGFFTPPYETASSLKNRLERMYAAVTLGQVKGIAWFICRK